MPKVQSKISEHGEYLPFDGITILSKVKSPETLFWLKLNAALRLNETFKKYYQALPVSSYHMTAINLKTKNSASQNNLIRHITENQALYQGLRDMLNIDPSDITVNIQAIYADNRSCKLIVRLHSASAQENIEQVARRFHLTSKIPKLFHITLGYSFKELSFFDTFKLQYELTKLLNKLCGRFGSSFQLEAPSLHSFNSMTSYNTWDGSIAPFIEQSSVKPSFFSSSFEVKEALNTSFAQNKQANKDKDITPQSTLLEETNDAEGDLFPTSSIGK